MDTFVTSEEVRICGWKYSLVVHELSKFLRQCHANQVLVL